MAEFTKGKWARDNARKYYNADVIRMNGIVIAEVNHDMTLKDDEVNANANLLAAAPDMYEALKDLQMQVRAHFKLDVKKHYSLMVADVIANKALAKAEGKDHDG